ncbi:MAG: DUF4157 domain-containing protein, partial [Spirulina sp. SIO3F2]|nr:DUF4157 domain-containing protein [Spirulina sp. SIO3F2]
GQPLADSVRQPMENAFGANFGGVRIHTDNTADQLNRSIQAQAFTTGQDVFFRQGAYTPTNKGGQELLAHELTHVVQQSGAGASDVSSIQGQVVQRRLPPKEAIEITLDTVEGKAGQEEAKANLYRLFYIEHQQDRLVKPVTRVPYDDPEDAVSTVFPNDQFDADAYESLYVVNEQYSEVLASEQGLHNDDWNRIAQVVVNASQLANSCSTRGLWITEVFGPSDDRNYNADYVSGVYKKAAKRLAGFGQDNFTIDYHGDDAEMHVAGSTSPGSGKIKLSPKTVEADERNLSTVLLHEACHEVDARVIDCGYYGTARFTKMSQKQKKKNAAHYEEIAKRIVGTSRYDGQTFVPEAAQQAQLGRLETFKVRERHANEALRGLWNISLSLHGILRDMASGTNMYNMNNEQAARFVTAVKTAYSLGTAGNEEGAPIITQLELALMESTVNVFGRAMKQVKKLKSGADRTEQDRLLAMSVKEVGMEAIYQVGGFQGMTYDMDNNHVDRIKAGVMMAPISQGDPCPQFNA